MKHSKHSLAPPPATLEALITLYNNRDYPEAENQARLLLAKYSQTGLLWKLLGASLQLQGKDALSTFQQAAQLQPDDAEVHNTLGNLFKDRGQLTDAVHHYRQALTLKPDYADAHNNLGIALKDLGQLNEAVHSYRQALQYQPDFTLACYNLGNALKALGQLDEAARSYRQAIALKPDFAEAYTNLGTALKELGQYDAALTSYQRVVELNPGFAEAHNNLGVALKDLGQLDAALVSYRRAVELKPTYAEAHNNLGTVLQMLGQPDAALGSFRRAVEIEPDFVEAHSNLGNALFNAGRLGEAESQARVLVERYPDCGFVWKLLGVTLHRLGKDALPALKKAVKLLPNDAEAYYNLGVTQKSLGQLESAVTSYRRALELKPDIADAYNNLGIILQDLGQFDSAEANYRQALEVKPGYLEAYNNLLLTFNYTTNHTPLYCFEHACQYGRIVAEKVGTCFSAWQSVARPERLRVGLISGDLYNHVVGHFLEGLLAHINSARVELIAYPTHHKEDDLTKRIRPYFSAWKPLIGKSDEAAAHLIHADGVHILLDISGHTAFNRLPVFAWKPAPVQASWLGYFATTGVAEMDYLLADEVGVPEAQRQQFTESIWYLPNTRLCFTVPKSNLPVAPLPALLNCRITFGCFQNLAKVSDGVLVAWGEIFATLPDTRLRMQCKQFADPTVAAQFVERLQRHGIDPTRVIMHGAVSREAYLNAYAEVDFILDTFPFPGGTTTCEALWMGVPTLTLAGDTLLARQGASLLTAAGLRDWIATSLADYVDKAVALAGDLPKLVALRAGLREQVSTSPLYDAKRFARNFEAALWGMWQARTQGTSPPDL